MALEQRRNEMPCFQSISYVPLTMQRRLDRPANARESVHPQEIYRRKPVNNDSGEQPAGS
jgi:hypothetical protein